MYFLPHAMRSFWRCLASEGVVPAEIVGADVALYSLSLSLIFFAAMSDVGDEKEEEEEEQEQQEEDDDDDNEEEEEGEREKRRERRRKLAMTLRPVFRTLIQRTLHRR